MLDGEIVVIVDGVQEFDLLSPAHPPGRVARRDAAPRRPRPAFVAFDLLAEGDEELLELPYDERRERLEEVVTDPVQLTPCTDEPRGRRRVADRHSPRA